MSSEMQKASSSILPCAGYDLRWRDRDSPKDPSAPNPKVCHGAPEEVVGKGLEARREHEIWVF